MPPCRLTTQRALVCALFLTVALSCDVPPPWIVALDPPTDVTHTGGPYRITALIDGPVDRVTIHWSAASPDMVGTPMTHTQAMAHHGGDHWYADLDGQPPGTTMLLYVLAEGPGGETRAPATGVLTFSVRSSSGFDRP